MLCSPQSFSVHSNIPLVYIRLLYSKIGVADSLYQTTKIRIQPKERFAGSSKYSTIFSFTEGQLVTFAEPDRRPDDEQPEA